MVINKKAELQYLERNFFCSNEKRFLNTVLFVFDYSHHLDTLYNRLSLLEKIA